MDNKMEDASRNGAYRPACLTFDEKQVILTILSGWEVRMKEIMINIAEAKKRFSELIGQVAFGKKRLLITKRGKPMARLVPVDESVPHLKEAEGWLDEDDPFFVAIDRIVEDRTRHMPRVLSEPGGQ